VLRSASIAAAGVAPFEACVDAKEAVGFGVGCGASAMSAVSRCVFGLLLDGTPLERMVLDRLDDDVTVADTTGSEGSSASSFPHEGQEAVPSFEYDSQRPQTMPIPGSIERSAAYYSSRPFVHFVTRENSAVLSVFRITRSS
jgi:hypothetical protein